MLLGTDLVLELLGGERASDSGEDGEVAHRRTRRSFGTAGSVISPATPTGDTTAEPCSRSFVESTELRGEFSIEIFLHDPACSDQTIRCRRSHCESHSGDEVEAARARAVLASGGTASADPIGLISLSTMPKRLAVREEL